MRKEVLGKGTYTMICKLFDVDKLMKIMQAVEKGEANGPG